MTSISALSPTGGDDPKEAAAFVLAKCEGDAPVTAIIVMVFHEGEFETKVFGTLNLAQVAFAGLCLANTAVQ